MACIWPKLVTNEKLQRPVYGQKQLYLPLPPITVKTRVQEPIILRVSRIRFLYIELGSRISACRFSITRYLYAGFAAGNLFAFCAPGCKLNEYGEFIFLMIFLLKFRPVFYDVSDIKLPLKSYCHPGSFAGMLQFKMI